MGIFSKKYHPGNANFETNFLQFSNEEICVKYTLKSLFFYSVFALIGIGVASAGFFAESDDSPVPLYIFGGIFFAAGAWRILTVVKRSYPVIDLRTRIFYPEGRTPGALPGTDVALPLSGLQKIDISSRMVRTSKSSYRCYTLTLIFNGDRDFVLLNHGALKAFMRDAKLLSEYLRMPLPVEDFEAQIAAGNRKAAPFLLIFSIIWTGFSGWIHFMAWQETEKAGVFLTIPFLLIGIILFIHSFNKVTCR